MISNKFACLATFAAVLLLNCPLHGASPTEITVAPGGEERSLQPEAKLITIKTSGTGESESAATKNALQSAVEQAIGALTYTTTTIKNEDISMARIDVLSNGFVKSFKKLSSKREGDLWTVSIDAVVQNGTVADFLKTKGIQSKVDLKNSWSQMTTGLNAKKQAIDLYKAKIPEIKARLFRVELVDLKTGLVAKSMPAPYIEDDLDGNATCLWGVRIAPDLEFWNECAYPLLDACFKTLCVGKKTIRVRYQTSNQALSYVLHNKTPKNIPPLLRVADPKLSYLSEGHDPGLHVSLFLGEQGGNYQGQLVYEGQNGLYCVILEHPVNQLESQVTAYFLKEEIIDRIYPKNRQHASSSRGLEHRDSDSWTLDGLALGSDGTTYTWNLKDKIDGIIGTPVEPTGIPRLSGPLYFGPWIQCNGGHYQTMSGASEWPLWKNLSCYSAPHEQGWGLNIIHDGKMYPLGWNFGMEPPPIAQFIYLPLIFKMPVDALPKITKITASLKVDSPIGSQ